MFTNMLFLSQGIQIALLVLLVGLILVFMKITALEVRIKNVEESMGKYVRNEDYFETFNNMFEERWNEYLEE